MVFPVHELAAELVAEIFLQTTHDDDRIPTFKPEEAPVKLTHICSAWRHIALATPRLWARLQLNIWPPSPSDTDSPQAELLAQWLRRSGSCPLTLHVRYEGEQRFPGGSTYSNQVLGLAGVFKVLLPYSHQWQEIVGRFPCEGVIGIVDVINSKQASNLETLRLLSIGSAPVHFQTPKIQFERAPNLKVFDSRSAEIKFLFTAPMANLRQFTYSMSRHVTQVADIYSILACCPSLEELDLNITLPEPPIPALNHIQHNKLLSFRLCQDYSDPGPLLDGLCLPSLLSLHIENESGPGGPSWPHVASLLKRSGTSLKALSLSDVPMDDEDFITCLRLSPHLEYLDLAYMTLSQVVLRALIRPLPGTGRVGPLHHSLETLMISTCWPVLNEGDNVKLEESAVFELIRAVIISWCHSDYDRDTGRWGPLQEVGLNIFNSIDIFQQDPHLQECMDNGLEVDIHEAWKAPKFRRDWIWTQ